MTRKVFFVLLALVLLFLAVTPVMAAPGGMPGAHGVEPGDWGKAVSALAKTYPGAVADHIRGCGGE